MRAKVRVSMGSRAAEIWTIGGPNVDIKAKATGALCTGTSSPGRIHHGFGGVARHVAENLGRLGNQP